MYESLKEQLEVTLGEIRAAGLYKSERSIDSAQGTHIQANQKDLLNFCANNYLGLANDERVIIAAKQVLDERGFGLASVRFICGTQDIHKELEDEVSSFLGTDDTILFSSCLFKNYKILET